MNGGSDVGRLTSGHLPIPHAIIRLPKTADALTPMKHGEILHRDIERFFALRQHGDDATFNRRLRALQDWQAARLQHTHDYLLGHPKAEPGVRFLLEDIYGGRDLRPVALEIRRALPKAMKLLPDRVMATSASALEAAILTQSLDEGLVERLGARLDAPLDEADYIAAYLDQAREHLDDRHQQLALVGELGHHIDRYVRSRMIQTTFRMVRRPAHAAGFASLYDFLDRAFRAMKTLDSVGEMLALIATDEREILQRILAGESQPFTPRPGSREEHR